MKLSRRLLWPTLLVAISAITIGASAGGAAAASPKESILMTLTGTTPQGAPPFPTITGGSFMAFGEFADGGSVAAQGVLPLQPPKSTQIVTFRQLTSTSTPSQGTLDLRCTDISRPAAPSAFTGSCAVLSATGAYAGLRGAGAGTIANGTVVLNSDGTSTLTDTVTFYAR
jgi:hypothetical protein